VLLEDLLQGDFAMQFGVECHEDGAETAAGMGAEDAEPLTVGGGRAHRDAGGAVGVIVIGAGRRMGQADASEGRLDLRVAQVGQALARGPGGGDGGEALLRVAGVSLDVQGGQGLDGGSLGGIEVAQRDQVVGQGPRLVAGPGVERGHELRLLDQAGLQGEQAEEEMAVGVRAGHGGILAVIGGRGTSLPSIARAGAATPATIVCHL
jgi:hypothetical protein